MKKFKAGELWTGSGYGYGTKPRPFLIVQSMDTDALQSEITAIVTSDDNEGLPAFRYAVPATPENGLLNDSFVCLDKLTTLNKNDLVIKCGNITSWQLHEIRIKMGNVLGIFQELGVTEEMELQNA